MKKIFYLVGILTLLFATNAFAQLSVPRISQRQEISQTVGDTNIEIVYHRPNVKERQIWGELVPFGEVWRTGANEATIFEVSNDVMINGQKLPKGKYSLFTIPNKDEWTIIFNKVWNQAGSANYKEAEDALRVKVKPLTGNFMETMTIGVEDVTDNSANIVIAWDKTRVPFKLDIGDVSDRILKSARNQMVGTPITAANFVMSNKMTANYEEALGWLNNSLETAETYGGLLTKARLLAEMGRKQDAIKTGEKAIEVGKKANTNTDFLEGLLKDWKTAK